MASFHFSGDTPPESMLTDIQNLNKFPEEQYNELLAAVFAFLSEPSKSTRLFGQLEEFSQQYGISINVLKNITKSLLTFQHSSLRKKLGPPQVKEDLANLGLSEEKSSYFSEQWKINLVALSRSALGQTLMVNQLVDMEWKFGVTAASSDVDKVGNTFLQLKLVINKGNKTENIYMELTLPQFYSFLHEMEKAKASLEYFS